MYIAVLMQRMPDGQFVPLGIMAKDYKLDSLMWKLKVMFPNGHWDEVYNIHFINKDMEIQSFRRIPNG